MAESPRVCFVCQRLRTRGSHDPDQDVFLCAECESDAKLFIEVQGSIGGSAPAEGVTELSPEL